MEYAAIFIPSVMEKQLAGTGIYLGKSKARYGAQIWPPPWPHSHSFLGFSRELCWRAQDSRGFFARISLAKKERAAKPFLLAFQTIGNNVKQVAL
jgi:hypothetical protein